MREVSRRPHKYDARYEGARLRLADIGTGKREARLEGGDLILLRCEVA